MPLGGGQIQLHFLSWTSAFLASRRVSSRHVVIPAPFEKHSVTRSYISTQLLSLQNYLTLP